MSPGNQSNYFVHTLLRARDWQHRPQFDEVCAWWRGGGHGVCALVGMGGAGKTAIAERFLRVLPDVTEPEDQLAKDSSLRTPNRLFVFSFYKDNEDRFFGELFAWLKGQPYDESARTPSLHQTLDLLKSAPCLLVLDGFEKVQDDGARGGVFGQITDRRLSDVVQRVALGLVPGVAALITTRFPIAELEEQRPAHFLPIHVEEISDDAGMSLLKTRGVRGAKAQLLRIVHDCGNHALTVDLAGGYIAEFAHGDPKTPLQLETTPKQEAEINAEPHPQRRYVMRQGHRFARVAERYRDGFTERDPATLALLERACLFRLGVEAATLASIFTGKDKQTISGEHLARLSQQQLEQKLRLLTEMRLLEANESSQRSTRYTIHPAVRAGFLSGIGREVATASHEAVRKGLEVSLGDAPGKNPSDPVTLDLLEEIVHHTLQSGHVQEAWDIYQDRIGGYENLGWRLGAYERGERICHAFAAGQSLESLRPFTLEGEGQGKGEPGTEHATDPPYLALSETTQGTFINEWALYLKPLGRLAAAARCYELNIEMRMRQEKWENASIGNQNLCGVWLLSGRLNGATGKAGLSTAAEALRLAERADDVDNRYHSHAYRAHVLALRGEIPAALADFRAALDWQHKSEYSDDRPLYRFADWQAQLLCGIGRRREAEQFIIQSDVVLKRVRGVDNHLHPHCNLVLSDLPGESRDASTRESLCRSARDWASQRDAKEILCWSALVQARLELAAVRSDRIHAVDGVIGPDESGHYERAETAIAEGLKIARDCGFGLYHIDLLLEAARLHLLRGDPQSALDDLRLALDDSTPANDETGQPELLAANDEACGYAWAIPAGLHLRAEAQLLQAAQLLGEATYKPRSRKTPAEARELIKQAKSNLRKAMTRWKKLHDPEPERPDQNFQLDGKQYNYQAEGVFQCLTELNDGLLTTYPLNTIDAKRKPQATEKREQSMSAISQPRVLISYSHDSDAHADRVRELSDRLRGDGVDCRIDQYISNPSEGWPLWMDKQVDESKFVLVVFTERYTTRSSEPRKSGVRFECVLILQELYEAGMINDKFIPVLFDGSDSKHIVKWLKPFNHYTVDRDDGYESLRRRLLDDPAIVPPPVAIPVKKGPTNP